MNLTEGQKIVIKSADHTGLVFAQTEARKFVCQKLVKMRLLDRTWGLIYSLTPKGQEVRAELLAEEDAES